MKNFKQLREAIANNTPLAWNDPDYMAGNDYNITFVEDLSDSDDWDLDTPILIQYGHGSEAQVFLHEIIKA